MVCPGWMLVPMLVVCGPVAAQSASWARAAVGGWELLPDSPGASAGRASGTAGEAARGAAQSAPQSGPSKRGALPCTRRMSSTDPEALSAEESRTPCAVSANPYRIFQNVNTPVPFTPKQKGYLAFHDVIDPFNILTILGNSAFTVGINAHTAYGPGMAGFGRNVGVSFVQDATGEFIGTFGVCSLFKQDPHYYREPNATARHRLVHALAHTVLSQHDDGRRMPNYENFITYPASAEIANLYVPGIHGDGPSTVARILTGLATDPVNNIITEFLPDFAKRVHIRVVFVQQILNQIATGQQI